MLQTPLDLRLAHLLPPSHRRPRADRLRPCRPRRSSRLLRSLSKSSEGLGEVVGEDHDQEDVGVAARDDTRGPQSDGRAGVVVSVGEHAPAPSMYAGSRPTCAGRRVAGRALRETGLPGLVAPAGGPCAQSSRDEAERLASSGVGITIIHIGTAIGASRLLDGGLARRRSSSSGRASPDRPSVRRRRRRSAG